METGEEKEMKQFVTFEGIDGSGKSTVSKKVYEKLSDMGYKVVLTYEPTDTWIGKQVQTCIKNNYDPFVTAFTFISDRIIHGKKIRKWIKDGHIVLCDRYADSTYAYQGAQMQGQLDDPIKWLKDLSEGRIPIPDRTFLLIIEPEEAVKRIQHRQDLIPFEKVDFLEKVHKNYLSLAVGEHFRKIDATEKPEEIVDKCMEDILHL